MRWTAKQYRDYLGKNNEKSCAPDAGHKNKNTRKYRNEPVTVNGTVFQSKKEADYYEMLLWLKKTEQVSEIELQPSFELQPAYTKNGRRVRAITYVADFRVTYSCGKVEVVDTKGYETREFKLKKKILEYQYPDITLVVV